MAAAVPSEWAPTFRAHPRPAPGPPTAPQCPSCRSQRLSPPPLPAALPPLQGWNFLLPAAPLGGTFRAADPRQHSTAPSQAPPNSELQILRQKSSSGEVTPQAKTDPEIAPYTPTRGPPLTAPPPNPRGGHSTLGVVGLSGRPAVVPALSLYHARSAGSVQSSGLRMPNTSQVPNVWVTKRLGNNKLCCTYYQSHHLIREAVARKQKGQNLG